MPMKSHRRPFWLSSVVLVVLAACAAPQAAPQQAGVGASAAPAAAPSAGSPASTAPSRAPGAAAPRNYAPVVDPAAGTTVKVREYWDYEAGTPFEVEGYEAAIGADRDADGVAELRVSAEVKLPGRKVQQAEADEASEDDETAEEEANEGEEAADDVDAPEAEAADDDDAEADAWIDDADDGVWEFTGHEDADGDGAVEADEAYAEDWTEAEEDAVLAAAHEIEMELEDLDFMANDVDSVWLEDKTAGGGEVLITYDQEWTRFMVTSAAGELAVEQLPDGGYAIDGAPAADVAGAARALAGSEVVRAISPHALAFLAARLGRIGDEAEASRSSGYRCSARDQDSVMCGDPRTTRPRGYRIANADNGVAQAHALVAALVDLLVDAPADGGV